MPKVNAGRRAKIVTLSLFGALVAFFVWWLVFRAPSPDEVAQTATQALAKGDVETLVALTLPEEREKLNLTPRRVRAMLTETFYADGLPGPLRVKRTQEHPVDQFCYEITPVNGKTDFKGRVYPLTTMITQRPDGRWYLPLGYLLLNTCNLPNQDDATYPARVRFRALARRYGIKGMRLNTFGYEYIDQWPFTILDEPAPKP